MMNNIVLGLLISLMAGLILGLVAFLWIARVKDFPVFLSAYEKIISRIIKVFIIAIILIGIAGYSFGRIKISDWILILKENFMSQ